MLIEWIHNKPGQKIRCRESWINEATEQCPVCGKIRIPRPELGSSPTPSATSDGGLFP